MADQPKAIKDASLSKELVLHLAVSYESGSTLHLTTQLDPDNEWTYGEAHRMGILEGKLPPTAWPITTNPTGLESPGHVQVMFRYHRATDGSQDHTVWVIGAGCETILDLPAPLDWGKPGPVLATLASPFTFVVDLVTAPIWVAWVFYTVGGHGDCWLPWCK